MSPFERLRAVTAAAQREQELPDYLAEKIDRIIERRCRFTGRETEIDRLATMVESYDTYGQTGYLGMGVNHSILEKALDHLLESPSCAGR